MNTRLTSRMMCATVYCLTTFSSLAQENRLNDVSNKVYIAVAHSLKKKASSVDEKLDRRTRKYLNSMEGCEMKLRRKLFGKGAAVAKQLFDSTASNYNKLKKFSRTTNLPNLFYSGHLDSVTTSLRFMQPLLPNAEVKSEIKKAIDKCNRLQETFNQASQVQTYLRQRMLELKEQFEQIGMFKELKSFQKQVYHYRAYLSEYEKIFEHESRLEARLKRMILELPQFKQFFSKNSALARMFPNLANTGEDISNSKVIGLQTRVAITEYLNTAFGNATNMKRAVPQNIQSAQASIDQLRSTLSSLQNGGYSNYDDLAIPDFKPNDQRTKNFFRRLECGTNFQSVGSNRFFPVTTDLGLSVGFRLNDKNIIGIGASYKIGWGRNISHLDISSEGAGLRSFLDLKLAKSLCLSGGFEYNYQKPFHSLTIIKDLSAWQQSGLIGVSKLISLNTKIFKKTKIQLLWDFLSYQQRPQTHALKCRIGYNF